VGAKPFSPTFLPLKGVSMEPLIPLIGRAHDAMARYDGLLSGIPNPSIFIAPMTTQEATLSSKIEGTQATLGEVFQYEAGHEPKQAERRDDIIEILNYRRALKQAEHGLEMRPFNLNLLKELHAILLEGARGEDKARGEFRSTQNYIGRPGSKIDNAVFVPPSPMQLTEFLYNWESYYHSADEPDILVQLAVLHAQFEILHPFLDGNGRLGRIIIPLFLYERKMLPMPVFYLSRYLETHRDEYYAKLRAIDNSAEAWIDWIAFFLRAVDEQGRQNCDLARCIMKLYDDCKVSVGKSIHSQFTVPLLDAIFKRPVFTTSQISFEGTAPSVPVLYGLIQNLVDLGILKVVEKKSGRKPARYAFPKLVNLCENRTVF